MYVKVTTHPQRTAYAVIEPPQGLVGYVWSIRRRRTVPVRYNGHDVHTEIIWHFGLTPDKEHPESKGYLSRTVAELSLHDRMIDE